MNTIYRRVLLACIVGMGSIPLKMMAQKAVSDSILNPHINVEREYTPIILDATKINNTPTRHEVSATQFPLIFENTVPLLKNLPYQINNLGSGSINTQIDYNKHRGYLTLGGGTRLNLEGALGYRIVESSKDQLDLFANHNSTNGNVDFLDPNPLFKKTKAKNMENFVEAKYSHQFSSLIWYLNASFLNNSFNYYGNPYWNPLITNPITTNIDEKQNVNIITAETGIKSADYANIEYAAKIKYDNISYKYGPNINFDGPKANIFDGSFLLAKSINADQKIGLKASGLYQSIDHVRFPISTSSNFHNLTVLKANPYYQIENGDIMLSVGAKVNYALDINDKFLISPTVDASWLFNDKSSIYLTVDGGINDNNLVDIYGTNKYANTNSRIAISRTLYNAQLGFRTGGIDGIEFDIHGGYKYTKDEHLFTTESNESWANVSKPIYANLGTGNVGGMLKTYLIPYVNLSLLADAYFYNLKDFSNLNTENPTDNKPWGLPNLRLNANVDFTFVPNLIFTVNYLLESGRKNYVGQNVIDMKNINELNINGIYNFSSKLSVYGKVGNILNKKYERYYGYTLQGINVMGGVALNF